MRWSLVCFVVACGGDDPGSNPPVDAPVAAGTPVVKVTAPEAANAFYVSESVAVAWTVTDDDPSVTCDVSASDNGGAAIPIASGVVVAMGSSGSAAWATTGVAPDTHYVVTVACSDGTLTGSGKSGEFAISPPAEQVAFSTVTAIFEQSCNSTQCHDNVQPQDGLDLTPSAAFNELVDQPSAHCASTLLVKPGAPSESYLVHKLQGNGPCFIGTKMPKPPDALDPAKIQQIRDWIFNGAPST